MRLRRRRGRFIFVLGCVKNKYYAPAAQLVKGMIVNIENAALPQYVKKAFRIYGVLNMYKNKKVVNI